MKSLLLVAVLLVAGCISPGPTEGLPSGDASSPDTDGSADDTQYTTWPPGHDGGVGNTTDNTTSTNGTASPSDGTSEATSEGRPQYYSGRFYLHGDGDDLWSARDKPTAGSIEGTTTAGTETWHVFEHRERLAVDVTFPSDQAHVKVHFSHKNSVVGDFEPQARLTIGDHVSTASAENGWITLDLPDSAPAGTEIQLEVCICAGSAATNSGYVLDLDGRSWWDIPYEA